MRIAFLRLLRTKSNPPAKLALQSCSYPTTHRLVQHHLGRFSIACRWHSSTTRASRTHHNTNNDTISVAKHRNRREEKKRFRKPHQDRERVIPLPVSSAAPSDLDARVQNFSSDERRNPDTWVRMAEVYLPWALRQNVDVPLSETDLVSPGHDIREVLPIVHLARKPYNAGIDILAYMMTGAKRKSALWLCEQLLKNLSSRNASRFLDLPPSNILWPKTSLNTMTNSTATVLEDVSASITDEPSEQWGNPELDPRYSPRYLPDSVGKSDNTMEQIWSTLGTVVVMAANMSDSDANRSMNAVHLVLSMLHNLNLVPDDVYSYQESPFSVAVQRPPVMHLVSSRILTALSDASWREQQDENIERAAKLGFSYKQIGRDPPGGRFRLKIGPIGLEIWLEFILWCCVEGGFTGAGVRIVQLLQRELKDPWFTITWSNSNPDSPITLRLDWEQLKTKSGGNIGQIGGYNKLKPLAEVPPRTISTEVVLALVETHIDSLRRVPHGKGVTTDAAQYAIVNLLAFLEPHDLPVSYFDYITSRLSQSGGFDQNQSRIIKKWSERLMFLRSMEVAQQPPLPQVSFQYESLLRHSEFAVGFVQQALESCVQESNIHDALKVFNTHQELVDNSKLRAIASFLQQQNLLSGGFFTSGLLNGNPEFVDSHGQLPLYRLAALLNLAIDTKLVGFGQWLLYNDDPDGPLIPRVAYSNSAISRSLIKFSELNNDPQLLEDALYSIRAYPRRKLTVNFLRTIFNARLSRLDFIGVIKTLRTLDRAQGGGFGLENLAHLAGIVLRIENGVQYFPATSDKDSLLDRCARLFSSILEGHFRGRAGVFQRRVRLRFNQQISHLLTLFDAFPESRLAGFVEVYRNRYRKSNLSNLPPSVFNRFLEAVVEAKGACAGVDLVDKFCAAPLDKYDNITKQAEGYIRDETTTLDMDWDDFLTKTSRDSDSLHRSTSQDTFIPFVGGLPDADRQDITSQETRTTSLDGDDNDAATSLHGTCDTVEDDALADESTHHPAAELSKIQVDAEELSITQSIGEGDEEPGFGSPFFAQPQPPTPPTAIKDDVQSGLIVDPAEFLTRYDRRTIRIIVRKASKEQRDSTERYEKEEASRALKWARARFVQLGATSTMIENEVQEPATESQMKTIPVVDKEFDRKLRRMNSDENRLISNSFRARRVKLEPEGEEE